MAKNSRRPSALELRQSAEVRLAQQAPQAFPEEVDAQRLLHELQVHQIELEMQNRSLQLSQLELESERARYSDLYDLAPVGYCTLSEQGLILQANRKAADLLGMSQHALVNQPITRFIHRDDQDRYYQHCSQLKASGESQACELRMVRLVCGEALPFWVHLESSVDKVTHGKVFSRITLNDISARKQAEESLKLFHEQLESLTSAIPGAVYQYQKTVVGESKFSYFSSGIEDIFGVTAAEAMRDAALLSEPILQEDRAAQLEAVQRSEAGLSLYDHDHRIRSKNGKIKWVRGRAMPLRQPDGSVLWNGILSDITNEKLAENQLLEMAYELERQVNVRTTSLRKLAAQLTMTEEREQRMLAQELHDNLSQLLAVVKIKLTTLVRIAPKPSIDEIVALVDKADQSVRTITRHLSPPVMRTLGFAPALKWLCDEMHRTYGLSVAIKEAGEPIALVEVVEVVLYRSVRELLINVARHAKIGEAGLFLQRDDSRLMLVVSDAGCGFDSGTFREALAGQHSFGLSSIFERITSIGGQMDVDSSPGGGSRITLSMPYAIAMQALQPS
ncbi:MAG: PAS domain S-box protein [Sterolibacterium sp.]